MELGTKGFPMTFIQYCLFQWYFIFPMKSQLSFLKRQSWGDGSLGLGFPAERRLVWKEANVSHSVVSWFHHCDLYSFHSRWFSEWIRHPTINWSIHSPLCFVTHSFSHSFIHSLICLWFSWLAHLIITFYHDFTHSIILVSIDYFNSAIRQCLTHSMAHSFADLLISLLIH
jgi:hypothetical protein